MDCLHRRSALCAALAFSWCVAVNAEHHANHDSEQIDDQMRRLMNPTPAELASEKKGRIHIYDSLDINQVDAALDNNFERIENMMFTRIHHLPPTGSGPVEVEDDGCD